jgi:hypothetical protein
MAQVQTARRRKVIAAPPTQTVDFGPDIRRRDVDVPARVRIVDGDIIVLEPAYTREADTVVTRRAIPKDQTGSKTLRSPFGGCHIVCTSKGR